MTCTETANTARRSRPVRAALRDAEAAAALAAENLGLLLKEAGRVAFQYAGGEAADVREELRRECVQAGWAGLRRAGELFDETLGLKFSTYSTGWILKHVRDAANEWAETRRHVSLDAPTGSEDGNATLGDFTADAETPDPVERVARADDAAFARRLLDSLPERERLVVSMYHGIGRSSGCTFAEIGTALGVTAQCVHRLYRRALKRLRPAA